MTKRLLVSGVGLTLGMMLGAGADARAGDTVAGEVVDLACYLRDTTTRGPALRKCTETCAKKGRAMGILADDGKLLLLLEDHDSPKPYADALSKVTQTITIEGDKVSQGGLNGIVVEEVK
jgi:hypothetical protein